MAIFFFKISKIPLLDSPAFFVFGGQVAKIRQKTKTLLGLTQGHKVQHLLVTWGRLKRFFLVQPSFLV
jgi:hypothetical protein